MLRVYVLQVCATALYVCYECMCVTSVCDCAL